MWDSPSLPYRDLLDMLMNGPDAIAQDHGDLGIGFAMNHPT
jgi:hypothetical protein